MAETLFLKGDVEKLALSGLCVVLFLFVCKPAFNQMVHGKNFSEFGRVFNVDVSRDPVNIEAVLVEHTASGTVLWPGDSAAFTIQLVIHTTNDVDIRGTIEMISYGTKGRPGDIYRTHLRHAGERT